jgi:F0F1-type ATP synthase epsilon subunit
LEILVEQAVSAKEINSDEAKKDLSSAEAELAKWGDKAQDGDYLNLVQRVGWARARLDAVGH